MARQALYRKWRPQTLEEIVGQNAIARTLSNALRDERVAHAYLFTGPRGTGKTSTARILAKAINCVGKGSQKPCNHCTLCENITNGSCMDLIEIDAASNTSVDDVRALRDKVHFLPSEGHYKVYIIDEVHMLSKSAFNALLKTLEEPPAHAIFVLATTEPQKIPATVLSRCQRFDFRRIPLADIVKQLQRVAEKEDVEAEPSALELIARQARGSLRDALSLLDQLISYEGNQITTARSRDILGLASQEAIGNLVGLVTGSNTGEALALASQMIDRGIQPRQLTIEILEYLRCLLLIQAGVGHDVLNLPEGERAKMSRQAQSLSPPALMHTIRAFSQASWDIKRGLLPQLPLELALVAAASYEGTIQAPAAVSPPPPTVVAEKAATFLAPAMPAARETAPAPETPATPQTQGTAEEIAPVHPAAPEPAAPPHAEDQVAEHLPASPTVALDRETIAGKWEPFRQQLRESGPKGRQLAALLRYGEPVAVAGDKITLGFQFPIHRDKVSEPANRQVLQSNLAEFLEQPVIVECVMAKKKTRPVMQAPANPYEEAAQDPLVRDLMEKGGQIARVTNKT